MKVPFWLKLLGIELIVSIAFSLVLSLFCSIFWGFVVFKLFSTIFLVVFAFMFLAGISAYIFYISDEKKRKLKKEEVIKDFSLTTGTFTEVIPSFVDCPHNRTFLLRMINSLNDENGNTPLQNFLINVQKADISVPINEDTVATQTLIEIFLKLGGKCYIYLSKSEEISYHIVSPNGIVLFFDDINASILSENFKPKTK